MEAIIGIWQRDMLKFFRDKARLFGSFAMPFMFLIIFGSGMSGALSAMINSNDAAGPLADFNYIQFMFPGIIAMTTFNTSIFSSLSIVQDREFGYLKEILVSPISRTSIAIGKILGGATMAFLQGLLMMVFVPFIGIELSLPILIKLLPAMLLVSLTFTSLGLLIASRLKTAEGFQVVVQMLIFPMLFLSGAFFPLTGMPLWMNYLVKINPMTYAVDMFKRIILEAHTLDPSLLQAMGLNLTVFNYRVTLLGEVIFMSAAAVLMVFLSTISFNRSGDSP